MADTKQINKEYTKELRERYAKNGDTDMSDVELISLILSYTNVQSKLKETVAALETHFGAVRHAYHARYAELMRIDGMTHHASVLLLLIGKLVSMKGKKSPVGKRVAEYESMFSMMMCYAREEELWAAAIDGDGVVVAIERLVSGDDTQVTIAISKVIKFAMYHNTRKIIIAHSHPGAIEVEESSADVYSMNYIGSMLDNTGVELIGQVLVAGKKTKMIEYKPQRTT